MQVFLCGEPEFYCNAHLIRDEGDVSTDVVNYKKGSSYSKTTLKNCKVINTRSDFHSGALMTELLRCYRKQDLHLRPPDPLRSNSG